MATLSEWYEDIGYTDDTPSEIVSCCVYGPTGVGKTHFAGTFPNPFFIDTDRGLRTLKKFHHPYFAIRKGTKAYRQILVILNDIADKNPPFDKLKIETIVIDSITELANFLLTESMKYPNGAKETSRKIEDEKPQWDDYAKLSSRLDTIIKRCRDLNLNFVATAGRKIDKDELTGEFLGLPNIVGGYRDIIGHQFDEYFYFETDVTDGIATYNAYTSKHKYFEAKSRDGRPRKISNPSYDTLYKSVQNKNTEKGEKEKEVKKPSSSTQSVGKGSKTKTKTTSRTKKPTRR